MKKKNSKKNNRNFTKKKNHSSLDLSEKTKSWIMGVLMILAGIIFLFSLVGRAGMAGNIILETLSFLVGKTVFLFPFLFLLGGVLFFKKEAKKAFLAIFLGIILLIIGIAGIFSSVQFYQEKGAEESGFFNLKDGALGGLIGNSISSFLKGIFGLGVAFIINVAVFAIGMLILAQFLLHEKEEGDKKEKEEEEKEKKPSLIRRFLAPKFQVKEMPPFVGESSLTDEKRKAQEISPILTSPVGFSIKDLKAKLTDQREKIAYQRPPLELLEIDKGIPNSGDIQANSLIIKKTLQNFDIQVEMSEVNTGPTVTQYTLKPAEGVKLSRITALGNDLALALAAHSIRIEAPIPGRPLVGIEIPNKIRAQVRLRSLFSSPVFQNSPANLLISLGKDVAGNPMYADLARMPHLLVAGATGTGKTICLNSLILSLLYRNPPELLRFVLVDPKRVEFPVYNQLPHLLAPVILNVGHTVNALKWIIGEMERRFDVLAGTKARDIASYNATIADSEPLMPYIILVIDELADLMAARGRDVEAAIVRIAQMARAVGIHLIVATQRPSVEVITGLIKANITSRITFQVASQVDSRTVLDMAGAEKLLGAGDMLYISAETSKPKRVQSAYVSDKELKRVVGWFKKSDQPKEIFAEDLSESLEKTLSAPEETRESFFEGDDPLFEEAKRIVIESKKASASLLQRRLRVGYARAARLIDMLEDKGIIGPGDGAKPREVFFGNEERIS